jgi:predicted AlkP superfamily pyrophosphatase or phosphodiesterase
MISKILLVIFDGCRPDALWQARVPHVEQLWRGGAYTWNAQSVAPSFTLPAHMSMFRGVTPERHGVTDNSFQLSAVAFPSFVDIAHQHRRQTAMFYSWEQLRDLSAHGSLTVSYCRDGAVTPDADQIVAEEAAALLARERPDLLVVYLAESDLVGHAAGWMSAAYLQAIERMDGALGLLLATLDEANLRDEYTVLFLSDHGGHEHTHGTASPEDLTIPWIISGPPIKAGYPLTTPVRIHDTAATIAHLLGVPRPDVWEGQPVWEAFAHA